MSKVRIARALLVASAVAAGLSATSAQAQTGLQYFALTPCRAYDSRPSNPLPAATQRNVTIKGVCGVPATAKAVSLNATIATPHNNTKCANRSPNGLFSTISRSPCARHSGTGCS